MSSFMSQSFFYVTKKVIYSLKSPLRIFQNLHKLRKFFSIISLYLKFFEVSVLKDFFKKKVRVVTFLSILRMFKFLVDEFYLTFMLSEASEETLTAHRKTTFCESHFSSNTSIIIFL